jgi:hypothetical protein
MPLPSAPLPALCGDSSLNFVLQLHAADAKLYEKAFWLTLAGTEARKPFPDMLPVVLIMMKIWSFITRYLS